MTLPFRREYIHTFAAKRHFLGARHLKILIRFSFLRMPPHPPAPSEVAAPSADHPDNPQGLEFGYPYSPFIPQPSIYYYGGNRTQTLGMQM